MVPCDSSCMKYAFEIRIQRSSGSVTSKCLSATSKAKCDDWVRLLLRSHERAFKDPLQMAGISMNDHVKERASTLSIPAAAVGGRRNSAAATAGARRNSAQGAVAVTGMRRNSSAAAVAMSGLLTVEPRQRSSTWSASQTANNKKASNDNDSEFGDTSSEEDEENDEDMVYTSEYSMTRRKSAIADLLETAKQEDQRCSQYEALENETLMRRKLQITSVFQRMQDDNEIHRDWMPEALDLLGYQHPRVSLIDEVFGVLTTYQTLDHGEFAKFALMFEERQLEDYMEAFNAADVKHRGKIEESDVPQILDRCRISYASTALAELVSEACDSVAAGITSDSFKRLVSLLLAREGFSRKYLERLRAVFKRFDRRGMGKIMTSDLMNAVTWLAYSLEYSRTVEKISRAVDISSSGNPLGHLCEYEFIVCLRKVREHDDVLMHNYLKKHDRSGSGRLDRSEVMSLLRHVGYLPEHEAITHALIDAGVDISQDLGKADLYRFLDMYRRREGLSRDEIIEIDGAFKRYDRDQSDSINAVEVGKVLRWMGYLTSWELQQKLVAEVDVDHSGQLDLFEIRKLVRKYREREIATMKKAFAEYDLNSSGSIAKKNCLQALHRMGCKVEAGDCKVDSDDDTDDYEYSDDEEEPCSLSIYEFIHIATRIRREARVSYRINAGYTEEEVANLTESFDKYDIDSSGSICNESLRTLLEDLFPDLAASAKMRPQLVKLMKEVYDGDTEQAGLDFQEFLRLMRQFHDFQERDRLVREQDAIQATKFTLAEVEEFRSLFMGGTDDEVRTKLTLSDLQRMVEAICPLNHKHIADLREIFKQVCCEEADTETKMLGHFPEFLLIMRKLIDMNFANIVDRTAALAPEVSSIRRRTMRKKTTTKPRKKTRRNSNMRPLCTMKSTNSDMSMILGKTNSIPMSATDSEWEAPAEGSPSPCLARRRRSAVTLMVASV